MICDNGMCFRFKEVKDLSESTKEKDVIAVLKKAQQMISLGYVSSFCGLF